MELLGYLTDGNVTTFLLLLLRFSSILAFFPFFDSQLVPVSVRAALAFFFDDYVSSDSAFFGSYY
ncbi:flagellar biosynthesis protein [Helicobacter fennelliae]|uniref:Flagellar biosynthesis protein n=1 Tax=Helicobacter fennelliae TaxID=215 RepID=A0A2X3ELS9_9HELI|nr:flagellar biosynthetic protein FliR [Helicobacter fennelliae]SQC36324.1 flagellar biosynthesis protein [Helicobacter fennelliae]